MSGTDDVRWQYIALSRAISEPGASMAVAAIIVSDCGCSDWVIVAGMVE